MKPHTSIYFFGKRGPVKREMSLLFYTNGKSDSKVVSKEESMID